MEHGRFVIEVIFRLAERRFTSFLLSLVAGFWSIGTGWADKSVRPTFLLGGYTWLNTHETVN
jgi:hypothetical protein